MMKFLGGKFEREDRGVFPRAPGSVQVLRGEPDVVALIQGQWRPNGVINYKLL